MKCDLRLLAFRRVHGTLSAMPKRSSIVASHDTKSRARLETASVTVDGTIDGKNAAAVALGRMGGLKGGKARAEKLSSRARSSIARKAALARWEKSE
jgi:hypothetical protein